jgi:hypothetical protein
MEIFIFLFSFETRDFGGFNAGSRWFFFGPLVHCIALPARDCLVLKISTFFSILFEKSRKKLKILKIGNLQGRATVMMNKRSKRKSENGFETAKISSFL